MLYRELNTVGVYLPPAAGGEKIYAKKLKFCIAAVFVVCQRDNHILFWKLNCKNKQLTIL